MAPLMLCFILLSLNYSFGLKKQLCYDDDECIINAVIDKVYPRLMAGIPGVAPSDPLQLDYIVIDLPNITYALNDASLIGLKDCEFTKLNNTRQNSYTWFDYILECPVLTVKSEYELNGIIDSVPVEGKGTCKTTYNDYQFSMTGKHQKVNDEERRLHISIENYAIKSVLRGSVVNIQYNNLLFSSNETCDVHTKLIEKITRNPTMDAFMQKCLHNLMEFHKRVPVEDIHFKYVQ